MVETFKGKKIQVGTDGFVRLIDWMGDEKAIVDAARISHGNHEKEVTSSDIRLIRYLMRHHHTTPFEMCEIKLHVRVPMDTWRQWIRHRTANVNEVSTRYVNMGMPEVDSSHLSIHSFVLEYFSYVTRKQSDKRKQGSHGDVVLTPELTKKINKLCFMARDVYGDMIDAEVAREVARRYLLLSTYTEAYWKIDLHNLMNFLRLRMHPSAQKEIRDYANVIHEIFKVWLPNVSEAFDEYRLNAVSLSGSEIDKVLNGMSIEDVKEIIKKKRG